MSKQTINTGVAPNDKTGDSLRTAFNKVNENFDELYASKITIGNVDFVNNSSTQILTGLSSVTSTVFNGSLNGSMAASNLSGDTLPANVIYSQLTSVGTLNDLTVNGTITGNVDGTATSAYKLTNPILINGVSFDGTANINVTVNANTLTGSTLNPAVTTSSLTSLGTLQNLTTNKITVKSENLTQTSKFVTAENIVAGMYYTINTVGTTDFTAIGAANNQVGTSFLATAPGTGDGLVVQDLITTKPAGKIVLAVGVLRSFFEYEFTVRCPSVTTSDAVFVGLSAPAGNVGPNIWGGVLNVGAMVKQNGVIKFFVRNSSAIDTDAVSFELKYFTVSMDNS